MRTKTLAIAAALMAAGVASSMAQSNVYSLNVVGYVNYTLTGGNFFTAVANPLNTTNNTLAGIFGAGGVGLPTGSQVQVWDYALQDFVGYSKQPAGPGFSGGGATVPFPVGRGVFVKIVGANYTNTFVGEVLQGALTNSTLPNFNLIGSQVPQGGLASTDLGLNPAVGAQVQQWVVGIQDFVAHSKQPPQSGPAWSGGQPTFAVGEAFFLKNTTPYDWTRNFTVQ